jgi:membrane-bound lytic murein transglycosylase MltF
MNENDKKLMELLMQNKGKYRVYVENDSVSVFDEKEELIGDFSEFGYELLNHVFQYLEIDSGIV